MRGTASLALALATALAGPAAGEGPVAEDGRGFVGFVQQESLPWQALAVRGQPDGLRARVLSGSPAGSPAAMVVAHPPGWTRPRGYYEHDLEVFLLEGDLTVGERAMAPWHYANVPAGWSHGPLTSEAGARALYYTAGPLSFTPSGQDRPDARTDEVAVKDARAQPWTTPTVSAPGRPPLPLLIKHLKRDSRTGARTWLVAVIRDLRIPWEVHGTSEEGFLLEGEYTLGECLPAGPKVGVYAPGGYFFRPAEIVHSGPDSGTGSYAIWLMRTPRALDVRYLDQCPGGPPPQ